MGYVMFNSFYKRSRGGGGMQAHQVCKGHKMGGEQLIRCEVGPPFIGTEMG